MSVQEKRPGAIALGWWSVNIGARERPAARSLAARLRRASPAEALSWPEVHVLAERLGLGPAQASHLAQLVGLLAEVRENVGAPLAQRLGGAEPILSNLRFQRLMRAEGDDLNAQLRRAITMADRRCNVAALAADILHWDDAARARWCFQYFGADAPTEEPEEKTE